MVEDIVVTGTRVRRPLAPRHPGARRRHHRRDPGKPGHHRTRRRPGPDRRRRSTSRARRSPTAPTRSARPPCAASSPDQTLVLVNGTRRHASALVNVNGSIGRGSAAVDLNAIPTVALDRVEVLRDGASAQYGSDAIAGVINLRLREAREGGGANVTYGQYDTDGEDRARRSVTRPTAAPSPPRPGRAWRLGADGFLTLSAEYREPRADQPRGPRPARHPQRPHRPRFGDPEVEQWTVYANAGMPLTTGWEAYGWAGYQHRDSDGAAFPRLANNANNVPADLSRRLPAQDRHQLQGPVAGRRREGRDRRLERRLQPGLRPQRPGLPHRELAERHLWRGLADQLRCRQPDLRPTGLRRRRHPPVRGRPQRPAERRLGPGSPPGGLRDRSGRTGILEPRPLGPNTALAGGAQGFLGFQPSNEIDEDRDALGLYVDVEVPLTEKFTVSGAVRVEDYSDFGDAQTGKLAARYDFTPNFALRGSVSTGFRAPSLQQSSSPPPRPSSRTATWWRPAPSRPPATWRRPSAHEPLKPENSTNYSLGVVFRLGTFDLTVDAYKIDDRRPDRPVRTDQPQLLAPGRGPAGPAEHPGGALLPQRRGRPRPRASTSSAAIVCPPKRRATGTSPSPPTSTTST